MATRRLRALGVFVLATTGCVAGSPSIEGEIERADALLAATCDTHGVGAEPVATSDALVLDTEVPSNEFFVGWTQLPGEVSSDIEPSDLPRLAVSCPDDTLYPTHPQQGTKLYHRAQVARYRLRAEEFMHADDPACEVGQAKDFGLGYPRCLATGRYYYRIASDTFTDGCGNLYRGFWEQKYLAEDENIGTLLSRGRTIVERPGTDFPGQDFIPDWTYSLRPNDFVQLSPLFDGDLAAVADQQEQAEDMELFFDAESCRFVP